jgi:hypothetical protein
MHVVADALLLGRKDITGDMAGLEPRGAQRGDQEGVDVDAGPLGQPAAEMGTSSIPSWKRTSRP